MKILIATILFQVLIFSVSAQSKYIVYIDIGFEDIHRNNIGTMTSKRNKKPHVSPINYTNTIISALEKSYFNKSNFETTELTEEESVKLKDLPTKRWAEYLQFDAENYTHSLVITKNYYQLDMSKASYLYGSGFFAGADQSCTVYAAMNFTFFNLRNGKQTSFRYIDEGYRYRIINDLFDDDQNSNDQPISNIKYGFIEKAVETLISKQVYYIERQPLVRKKLLKINKL